MEDDLQKAITDALRTNLDLDDRTFKVRLHVKLDVYVDDIEEEI